MANNKPDITIRPTVFSDLDILFKFQQDKESGYLAAYAKRPDRQISLPKQT